MCELTVKLRAHTNAAALLAIAVRSVIRRLPECRRLHWDAAGDCSLPSSQGKILAALVGTTGGMAMSAAPRAVKAKSLPPLRPLPRPRASVCAMCLGQRP